MLNLIRVFIKVVELGSFSKAGNVLNMAPSSVARNIDSLENELQATLLTRSTRQLALTKEGIIFLEGASKLISDAEALQLSLKPNREEPEGIIKVSVFEGFGRTQICPILPEFLERYPKVKVEISLDDRVVDLLSEDVDLAIRVGKPVDSNLKARILLSNQTSICASPSYLEQYGIPQKPSDLKKHNCLLFGRYRQKVYWHFRKKKDYQKIEVQGNLISRGGTPLIESAIRGVGIIQLSHWMISDAIQEQKLVICLPDWDSSLYENTSGYIYAVYKEDKYAKPVTKVLVDFLVEKIKTNILQTHI
ncbi:MAG: DNA-binding transcriptional LysR family regulator [bacterium]|jgi:DNA-binding transcriptional LysR family regulator